MIPPVKYISSPSDYFPAKEVYISQLNLFHVVLFSTYSDSSWIDHSAVAVFKVKPKATGEKEATK